MIDLIGEEITLIVNRTKTIIKDAKGEDIKTLSITIDYFNEEKTINLYYAIKSKIIRFTSKDIQQKVLSLISEYDRQIALENNSNKNQKPRKNKNDIYLTAIEVELKSASMFSDKKLFRGGLYGTHSLKIYKDLCEVFGFKEEAYKDYRRKASGENASPEGYSIWFFPKSSLNAKKNENWTNYIAGNKIEVLYSENKNNDIFEKETSEVEKRPFRVVFANTPNGQYTFLGVYKTSGFDKEKRIVYFELICDEYPIVK